MRWRMTHLPLYLCATLFIAGVFLASESWGGNGHASATVCGWRDVDGNLYPLATDPTKKCPGFCCQDCGDGCQVYEREYTDERGFEHIPQRTIVISDSGHGEQQ